MGTQERLESAHRLVAACGGTLATMLETRKMSKTRVKDVADCLHHAATHLENLYEGL